MTHRLTIAEAVLVVGCLYEVASLTTRKVPPFTRIVKAVGDANVAGVQAGRFAVWAWCGYVAWHFLEPEA